jgi:hypothetical protein
MSVQIVVTVLVALILGVLASLGLYSALEPAAFTTSQPIYTYGTSN